jgi:amino acid transporter
MSNLPFFPAVLYFGAGSALFAFGARGQHLASSPGYYIAFAVGWLAIITFLNIVGVGPGKWLNNLSSVGSIVPLSLLVLLAAVSGLRFGSATHFTASSLVPHLTLQNAIFWSTVFFAFGGVEAGSFMGAEIQNPRRVIPRALLAGGSVLAIGYIAGTMALLVALPGNAVKGPDGFVHGFANLCVRLGLPWLVTGIALLVALNAVGGAAAFLSSTSRLPFVVGIDRYLPPVFGHVHPRFRTPWVAIGAYGIAAIFVALLSQAGTTVRGAYNVMVSMSIIAYFLPYLFLFAAMIRLQQRPAGPDVIRIPGGRWVAIALAAIGFVSTALTLALSIIPPEDETNKPLQIAKVVALTAVAIGAGVAVFLTAGRKAALSV